MPNVFLYAPQDFHNVCLLSRTLEVFGQRDCYVFDPHAVIRERYGKSRARELRAVSAGSFQKITWLKVEDPARCLADHAGRVVASVADATAPALTAHRFQATDLLLFGSESQGLPAEIVAASAARLTIPAFGQTQSLNLAVAFGIVLFEWQRQVGAAFTH